MLGSIICIFKGSHGLVGASVRGKWPISTVLGLDVSHNWHQNQRLKDSSSCNWQPENMGISVHPTVAVA